jgi:DNA mismatch endonuclease (patch repair protein)
MVDHLDTAKRSWNMSRIRGKDTKPEIAVRKMLHAAGFRFRLHVKDLLGKPDIVLPKWKAVVFVHGCFWHRHEGCKDASAPKSRTEWWQEKFEKNVANDLKNRSALEATGWKVVVVWECELKKNENLKSDLIWRIVND